MQKSNPEIIMIKVDTTLIHLEATLIEALRDPHSVEEDGKVKTEIQVIL